MIKNVTQFKVVINEVECVFSFDANCPTNIAKDALFACLKWIGQIEDAAKAQEVCQEVVSDEDPKQEEELSEA